MKRLCVCAAVLLMMILCTACFSNVQDDRSTAGERDGIAFSYLENEQLLIISGTEEITKDNRIFSLPFAEKLRSVYLTRGTVHLSTDALSGLPALETVFCADDKDAFGDLLSGIADLRYGVTDFETRTDLFSHAIGHCPVNEKNECLLCGERWRFAYENYRCRLMKNGRALSDATVTVEGKDLSFDGDGYLTVPAPGFYTLGGEKRFFDDKSEMAIGQKDIDGYRCSFSSDGILTDLRQIDNSVPVYQILLPVCALLCGGGACFAVYRFRKYKEKKEDERQ